MYKLKQELPKEFKIKVNPKQSEVLQKHLFSVGVKWADECVKIKNLDAVFIYFEENEIECDFKSSKKFFKKDVLPRIKFKDYFEKVEETSFHDKWCILVTQDNYQELNKWMHRNCKNYPKYQDSWEVTPPYNVNIHKYFVSCQIHSGHSIFHNQPDYTLITTEQFRAKYGDLNVTMAQGTKAGEKDYYGINSDTIEDVNWKEKAKYYKEKSDRLRKEKFDLNFKIGNLYGETNTLKQKLSNSEKEIKSKCDSMDKQSLKIMDLKDEIESKSTICIKQAKEIIKLKKYNEELANQVGIYYKQVLMLTEKLKTIKKVLQ